MRDKVFFPGLNGIRAIAALIVIVFHTDQWSHYFNLSSYGFWDLRMQSYAVVLFFVLSGFLITTLLLKEKEKYNKIDFKKFYLRRILRIWPVYYTVLFLGIFLIYKFPGSIALGENYNTIKVLFFYGFLLPNIGFYFGLSPDLIGILWSVGVEEQFYAFWPLLVNKSKRVLNTLVYSLVFYITLKVLISYFQITMGGVSLEILFSFLPFEAMMVGGITACVYLQKMRIMLQVLYHPVTQVLTWSFLIISIFYKPIHVPIPLPIIFDKFIHVIVYAVIILNVSTNSKTIISLENRFFNFIGRISYGIYAYHFLVLFLISLPLRYILPSVPSQIGHALMFISEIGVTIIVSHISYKYFESYFLKYKNRYTLVHSSNQSVEMIQAKQ